MPCLAHLWWSMFFAWEIKHWVRELIHSFVYSAHTHTQTHISSPPSAEEVLLCQQVCWSHDGSLHSYRHKAPVEDNGPIKACHRVNNLCLYGLPRTKTDTQGIQTLGFDCGSPAFHTSHMLFWFPKRYKEELLHIAYDSDNDRVHIGIILLCEVLASGIKYAWMFETNLGIFSSTLSNYIIIFLSIKTSMNNWKVWHHLL